MVLSHIVLTSRALLEGVAVVVCSQQWAHQPESSGRSGAIIVFRFPGLSPQSWT